MKFEFKDIVKSILFLIPIGIMVALFVFYEPCNYWNLWPASGDWNSSITVLRKINYSDCENIILCSSKLAGFSPEYLYDNGLIDEEWTNLSINAASIKEQCEIFWNTVKRHKPRQVLFTVAFWDVYRLGANRFTSEAVELSENGMAYYFNRNSQQTANLRILTEPFHEIAESHKNKYNPSEMVMHSNKEWRDIYDSYVERIWRPEEKKFSLLSENLVDIIDVINYCRKYHIELYIYSFPMQKAVWDFLRDAGYSDEVSFYKDYLSLYSQVYDMEFETSGWTDTYGFFLDGTHLNGNNYINSENPVVSDVYRTMFERNGEEMRILDHSIEMDEILEDENICLQGDSNIQVYAKELAVDADSIYVIQCEGSIPLDQEIMYMDFCDSAKADTESMDVPRNISDTSEYLAIISTKNKSFRESVFRIVYQGNEDMKLESLRIYKVYF